MLAWLLMAALADPPTPSPIDEATIISQDTLETIVYVFPITACDRVRAELPVVPTDGNVESLRKVVVTLQNRTMSTCLYKGLVLQGWLEGIYTPGQAVPDSTGMFVPPGGELSLRIKPFHPELPRGTIQLQLPPKSGAIVLIGTPP